MNALETQVLRLIGENTATPDVFSDDDVGMAQIRLSLNDAIQDLCLYSGAYKRKYLLPLLINRQFYRLAPQHDHIAWIAGVYDRLRKYPLRRIDLLTLTSEDPNWMDRQGPPLNYIPLGNNHVAIYMIPDSEGIVLEADCVCIPKPYTQDTAPAKLRETFQRAAVYLAVSEFHASRGNAQRAMEYHGQGLETAKLMGLTPSLPERQYRFGGQSYDQTTKAAP